MAIEAASSASAGDKPGGLRPSAARHAAQAQPNSPFATALEGLLGELGEGAPGDTEPGVTKVQADDATETDPSSLLGAANAAPSLPLDNGAAARVQTLVGQGAAPLVPAGKGEGAFQAVPAAGPAGPGAGAPTESAISTSPEGAGRPQEGTPQVGEADANAHASADANTSAGAGRPQRRSGPLPRGTAALDRTAALQAPSHEPVAAHGARGEPIGTGETGTPRAPLPAPVRVLSLSTQRAGSPETPGVAALSTLAFAGDASARRSMGAEPRWDPLSSLRSEVSGLPGELPAPEGSVGAAPPEPSTAHADTEEGLLSPRWAADGAQQTQLRIQDMPGGALDVHIQLSGGEASVGFSSAENSLRAALADSSAALSELLAREGIALVDVSVQSGLRDAPQQHTPSPGRDADPLATPRRSAGGEAAPVPGAATHSTRSGTGRLDVFV